MVGQNVCEFAFETNSETAKLWPHFRAPFLPRMSRETMKRRISSEKGGFAPNSGSALPPSRAGRGLIVNSRVTDWGWGNASSVWAETPFLGGKGGNRCKRLFLQAQKQSCASLIVTKPFGAPRCAAAGGTGICFVTHFKTKDKYCDIRC